MEEATTDTNIIKMEQSKENKKMMVETPLGRGEVLKALVLLDRPVKMENLEEGKRDPEEVRVVMVRNGRVVEEPVVFMPSEMREGLRMWLDRIKGKVEEIEEMRRVNALLIDRMADRLRVFEKLLENESRRLDV